MQLVDRFSMACVNLEKLLAFARYAPDLGALRDEDACLVTQARYDDPRNIVGEWLWRLVGLHHLTFFVFPKLKHVSIADCDFQS